MKPSQSIMNDQHRATPEQWQAIEANGHLPTRSTILELLHRVQALEATQHAHVDLSHLSDAERERMLKSIANPGRFEALEAITTAKPNHPAKPHSSLLSRVACADGPADAILEVAAWMGEQGGPIASGWAMRLEREAER